MPTRPSSGRAKSNPLISNMIFTLITAVGLTSASTAAQAAPNRDVYSVQVVGHEGIAFQAPTYAPTDADPDCLAQTPAGTLVAFFPRHDLCATLITDTGYALTDDLSIQVKLDRQGRISSLFVAGQDVIGEAGIMHISDTVVFDPPVPVTREGFVLHVDVDNLAIWMTDHHLLRNKPKKVQMVGRISLGDLIYVRVQ